MNRSRLLLIAILLGGNSQAAQSEAPGSTLASVSKSTASPASETTELLQWRYMTRSRNPYKPAVGHDGIIYVTSNDQHLYALYPDGSLKWRYKFESRPVTAPALGYDGAIYVGLRNGRLCALAPNGSLRWKFLTSSNGFAGSPATGSDGDIYMPGSDGVLHAISYAGELQWSLQFRSAIASNPSIGHDGSIYVSTGDRRLHAVNPDGQEKWQLALAGTPGAAITDGKGTIYVSSLGVHAISTDGGMLWEYLSPERMSDPVLDSEGRLFAGTSGGMLYALDSSGRRVWDLRLGYPILHGGAVARDGVVFVPASDRLYAVSPDGAVEWSFQITRDMASPALSRAGMLYVAAHDWKIYAIAGRHGGPADSPWPVVQHDSHNTSRVTGLMDLNGTAYTVLRRQLLSEYLELKASVLDDIEAYLRGRRYLSVHVQQLEWMLGYTVFEGLKHQASHYQKNRSNHPVHRFKSCVLLGELGTETAKSLLLEVVQVEQDLAVKRCAVDAIGWIGNDTNGAAARALERFVATPAVDERVVVALIGTLAMIHEYDGGFSDEAALRTLMQLAGDGYSKAVREKAADLLYTVSAQRSPDAAASGDADETAQRRERSNEEASTH